MHHQTGAIVRIALIVTVVSTFLWQASAALPADAMRGHHYVARHLISRDNAELLAAAGEVFDNEHDAHALNLFDHLQALIAHAVQASHRADEMSDEEAMLFQKDWADVDDLDDDDDDVDDVVTSMQQELAAMRDQSVHRLGPEEQAKRDALYVPFEAVLDHTVRYRRQPHRTYEGIRSVVDALIDDELIRLGMLPQDIASEKRETLIIEHGGALAVRVFDWMLYRKEAGDDDYLNSQAVHERTDVSLYFLTVHRKRQVEWDPESGKPEPEPAADAPWLIREIESFPIVHNALTLGQRQQ